MACRLLLQRGDPLPGFAAEDLSPQLTARCHHARNSWTQVLSDEGEGGPSRMPARRAWQRSHPPPGKETTDVSRARPSFRPCGARSENHGSSHRYALPRGRATTSEKTTRLCTPSPHRSHRADSGCNRTSVRASSPQGEGHHGRPAGTRPRKACVNHRECAPFRPQGGT